MKKIRQTTLIYPIFDPVTYQTVEKLKNSFSNAGERPSCLLAPPYIKKYFPVGTVSPESPSLGFVVSDIGNELYRIRLSEIVWYWEDIQRLEKKKLLSADLLSPIYAEDLQFTWDAYFEREKRLKAIEKLVWLEVDNYLRVLADDSFDNELMEGRLVTSPFDFTWSNPLKKSTE